MRPSGRSPDQKSPHSPACDHVCIFCERIFFAMRQYSSLCVSAVVLTLGGDDIEDGVPDREQVDCERERVEEGEKQERDKHEETTNERSNT